MCGCVGVYKGSGLAYSKPVKVSRGLTCAILLNKQNAANSEQKKESEIIAEHYLVYMWNLGRGAVNCTTVPIINMAQRDISTAIDSDNKSFHHPS